MIKVESISKNFGAKRAVDDVSFEVGKGEVLGFLGPNGAGKSTTMRMITGFIPADSGQISVCGFDVSEQPLQAKRKIGYLPESAPTYTEMTVNGFLRWAADMRGLSGEEKRRAVNRAIELCSLDSVIHQSIDTLSKGFRHRTCLAQAILHDPAVLIMDEPTDGLDPNQKHEIRNLIRRMSENKAIIFSTHILEEVEAVCTRAIIIDQGRIVANGSPDELKARSLRAGTVTLALRGASAQAVSDALKSVPQADRAESLGDHDGLVSLRIYPAAGQHRGALAAPLAAALSRDGWQIESLHTEEGRLDDVFRELTHGRAATPPAQQAA